MRTVDIGGERVELRGSALAPLTWYDAFREDTLYDALLRVNTHRSPAGLPLMPMLDILRVAWVMAHDADEAAGRPPAPFGAWVAAHAEVDFMALRAEVEAEAMASFFPRLKAAADDAAVQERKKGSRKGRAASPARGDAGERKEDGAEL